MAHPEPPRSLCLLLLTIWIASGAAPDAARADSDAIGRDCTRIVGDAERLACYDAAFGLAAPGRTTKQRAPVADSPADRFGDNGQLARTVRAKAEIPKTLTGEIVAVSTLPNGLYRLSLDNQQHWQTTETDWALDFKVGQNVTLTRMSMGGYQLSLDKGSRSVGARRLQ